MKRIKMGIKKRKNGKVSRVELDRRKCLKETLLKGKYK